MARLGIEKATDPREHLQRMAEIYQELGNREMARHHYGRFVTYWEDADDELQWRVEEARQRIEALSAEQ